MAKNYVGLTGNDIVKAVRRHNLWMLLSRGFLILFIAVILTVGMRYLWKSGHYIYLVLAVLVALLLFYMCIEAVGKAAATLKNVSRARVFRKYGAPDSIAMRISEGEPLLESNKTLLTDSFIMKHGDFESFIPFEDILLIYRKTQIRSCSFQEAYQPARQRFESDEIILWYVDLFELASLLLCCNFAFTNSHCNERRVQKTAKPICVQDLAVSMSPGRARIYIFVEIQFKLSQFISDQHSSTHANVD